jgi:hypothetical protein
MREVAAVASRVWQPGRCSRVVGMVWLTGWEGDPPAGSLLNAPALAIPPSVDAKRDRANTGTPPALRPSGPAGFAGLDTASGGPTAGDHPMVERADARCAYPCGQKKRSPIRAAR